MKTQTYLVALLMLLSSILLIKEKQSWAIVTNLIMLTFLSMYTWFQLNYFAKDNDSHSIDFFCYIYNPFDQRNIHKPSEHG